MDNQLDKVQTDNQQTKEKNDHTDQNTSLENNHTDQNISLENDHTDPNTSLENNHTDQNISLENNHTDQNTSLENNHTDQNISLENDHTDQNTSLENNHTDQNISLENDHTDQNTSLENNHTDQNTSLENNHNNNNNNNNNNLKDETQTQETSNSGMQKRITVSLGAAAFFGALGSSFLDGYSISVVNAAAPFVQDFYNKSWMDRYGEPLGEDRTTLLWSITVSIFAIGGIIGAVIVTMLIKVLGRKGTLLLNNGFSLAAAVLMGACEKAGSFEMLIIGRLVMGLNAGVGLNVIAIYLAEISPRHIRGSIGQMNSILMNSGVFIGQVWGLPEVLGQESRWNFLFAFVALPALLQLSVLPFLPESPRFLLMEKEDKPGAERAFRRFLGKEDVSQEMAEVHAEILVQRNMKVMSVLDLLRDPAVRWQIITVIVIRTCLPASGLSALFYYTDGVLEDAGIGSNLIPYLTLSTGVTRVLFAAITGIVIERVGRRLLLLIGFGGMAVGYALLTVFLNVQDRASWIPYLSFISILAVIATFSLGPGGVSYIVTSELFEQSYRPTAFMISGVLSWLFYFIVGLVFPYIQEALQTYMFLVFMVICLLCTIYIFIILPETKNKTFVEISHSFAKRNKIPVTSADLESNPENKVDGEAGHVVNGQTPVTSAEMRPAEREPHTFVFNSYCVTEM